MTTYLYTRINISSVNGGSYCNCAELQLRLTVGGADVCTGGTPTSSYNLSGYGPEKAFDDNTSTFWATYDRVAPQWIQYQHTEARDVVEISWTNRPDGYANESPAALEVLGSNNGTDWTTIASYLGIPTWSVGETRLFNLVPQQVVNRIIAQVEYEASQPGSVGSGGNIVGGSATLAYHKTYSISGTTGGLIGGSATLAYYKTYSILGTTGGLIGGSATLAYCKTYSISGTIGGLIGGTGSSIGVSIGGALPKVNIGGVWKTTVAVYINIGGVWKTVSLIAVKIGGEWKTTA